MSLRFNLKNNRLNTGGHFYFLNNFRNAAHYTLLRDSILSLFLSVERQTFELPLMRY